MKTPAHRALVVSVETRLRVLSHDELRVVDRVLAGLERGREVYGPLDVSRDPRNFVAEACQEMRDTLIYLAAHEIAVDDASSARHDVQGSPAASSGHETASGHLSHDESQGSPRLASSHRAPAVGIEAGTISGCPRCGATWSCDCAALGSPDRVDCPRCGTKAGQACMISAIARIYCPERVKALRALLSTAPPQDAVDTGGGDESRASGVHSRAEASSSSVATSPPVEAREPALFNPVERGLAEPANARPTVRGWCAFCCANVEHEYLQMPFGKLVSCPNCPQNRMAEFTEADPDATWPREKGVSLLSPRSAAGNAMEAAIIALVSARSDLLGNTTNGFQYESATRLVQKAIDILDDGLAGDSDDNHDARMAREFGLQR